MVEHICIFKKCNFFEKGFDQLSNGGGLYGLRFP